MDSRIDWYLDAKFGLFIHWGAYSVAGVEASWPIMAPRLAEAMFGTTTRITGAEYQSLPGRFNPVQFDPDMWVKMAQEAIRGTTYTPLHDLPIGRATRKQDKVYLHIFEWPEHGLIEVGEFPWKARCVRLFSGESLTFQQRDGQLKIDVPAQAPQPDVSVLVVNL